MDEMQEDKYPLPYAKTGKHILKTRQQDNSHIVNLGSWTGKKDWKQTMPPTKTIYEQFPDMNCAPGLDLPYHHQHLIGRKEDPTMLAKDKFMESQKL